MDPRQKLQAVFQADRAARDAEHALVSHPDSAALVAALSVAVEEALSLSDRAAATLRLERLADLCAEVPGPKMVDMLIRILSDAEPAVRLAAGEALVDVGYERYAEVARAVERALDEGMRGMAMEELPFVLAEIGEPSALPLIRRFLSLTEAEAVAAAVEALVTLGDPGAASALEALRQDERTVTIDDDASMTATVGELATEAIAALQP